MVRLGYINKERREGDAPNLLGNDRHDELVHGRAEEEGEEHGRLARELVGADRGGVDVAEEEGVHGLVPFPAEFIPGGGVPPILIELAVGETEPEGRLGLCLNIYINIRFENRQVLPLKDT